MRRLRPWPQAARRAQLTSRRGARARIRRAGHLGNRDTSPPSRPSASAAFPSARIELLEGHGHWVFLEDRKAGRLARHPTPSRATLRHGAERTKAPAPPRTARRLRSHPPISTSPPPAGSGLTAIVSADRVARGKCGSVGRRRWRHRRVRRGSVNHDQRDARRRWTNLRSGGRAADAHPLPTYRRSAPTRPVATASGITNDRAPRRLRDTRS
jgi:hypothetical protein